MPTQLFIREDTLAVGVSSSDFDVILSTARGPGLSSQSVNTVAGPTAGVQFYLTPTSYWFRVNAVTVSGAITKNLWMSESNMSANAGPQVIIDRHDSAGTFVSTVANHERGVELPVATRAAQNWNTGTVTSTSFSDGDWIRLRVYINDVGTMASGHSADFAMGATSAGVDGDSYITFTETITEYTPPAGYTPYRNPMPPLIAQ